MAQQKQPNKKRRKSRKNLLVLSASLFLLLIITIGVCFVQFFNSKKLTKNLNAAKAQTDTLHSQIGDLNSQLSAQSASIDDLKNQLLFYETPEESLDNSDPEAVIEPDAVETSAENSGDAYPNLYAAKKSPLTASNKKIAYLTFDDGPSNLTPTVLDLLDQYNAKATFFVIGTSNEEYQQYYSEIIERGHTLAMHSYTHNYQSIYASTDAFLADFNRLNDLIYEKTGYVCSLFRFPGGSKNSYDKAIVQDLRDAMESRGYIYYDWNVSCGDGSSAATKDSIYQKVMDEVQSYSTPVILMHDGAGHSETIAALPDILQSLSDQGFTFEALTPETKPVQFPR